MSDPDGRTCSRGIRISSSTGPGQRRGHEGRDARSEEHTSELQSQSNLVCRLLLEKNNNLQDSFEPIVPTHFGQVVETDDSMEISNPIEPDEKCRLLRCKRLVYEDRIRIDTCKLI